MVSIRNDFHLNICMLNDDIEQRTDGVECYFNLKSKSFQFRIRVQKTSSVAYTGEQVTLKEEPHLHSYQDLTTKYCQSILNVRKAQLLSFNIKSQTYFNRRTKHPNIHFQGFTASRLRKETFLFIHWRRELRTTNRW